MSDVPKMLPWSHSKLGLYEDCPARAKFRYIMKFPTTKHAAASRGTNTHQGIEDYLHGKIEFLPEESPAAKFLPMLAEIKKRKPLIEHKQAVDVEWSPAEFHECWGRCVVDAIVVAGAGVIGIALGFGAQTVVKDFLTGLFLIVEDVVSVGDIIRVGDLSLIHI